MTFSEENNILTSTNHQTLERIIKTGKPSYIQVKGVKVYIDPRPGNSHVKLKGSTAKYDIKEDEKVGGILPAIIPAIAAVLGATVALTSGVSAAVKSASDVRHNKRMEKIAKDALKKGSGCFDCIDRPGNSPSVKSVELAIEVLHDNGYIVTRA